MHLIAVDIGNSQIKIGLFAASADHAVALQSIHVEIIDLNSEICWDRFRQLLAGDAKVSGVIAATNPQHMDRISDSWPPDWSQPLQRVERNRLPIATAVPTPAQVGIDRLLNAIASNRHRQTDQATIIVDSGTATTIDLVSDQGIFQGGAILPGLALSARALHEYTALLPLIPLEALPQHCPPLGRATEPAICSGLLWGHVGAIRELTSHYLAASPNGAELILTGGAADLLHAHFPEFTLRKHLALEGLAIYGSTVPQ